MSGQDRLHWSVQGMASCWQGLALPLSLSLSFSQHFPPSCPDPDLFPSCYLTIPKCPPQYPGCASVGCPGGCHAGGPRLLWDSIPFPSPCCMLVHLPHCGCEAALDPPHAWDAPAGAALGAKGQDQSQRHGLVSPALLLCLPIAM